MKHKILIYGPHAEEYSLAKVNREFANALSQVIKGENLPYQVRLGADINSVARLAEGKDTSRYPYLRELTDAVDLSDNWDLVIYNNFPKDPNALHGLRDLPGKVKVAYLAWEEDRFPKRWVDEYNANLQLVLAATTHTQRVLKHSGVRVPIIIIPNALADSFFEKGKVQPSRIKTTKKFRFLHISSGMERKGVRELIEAYNQAFTAKDDVCLVIKSFPNANNLFHDELAKYKGLPDAPTVEIIEADDLTEAEVIALYKDSHVYLSPSKAEGFNIPVLEAMFHGLPVITTAWSGQMDFVNDENAYLVDYELVPAQSHLDNPGAYWAQPNVQDLVEKMKRAFVLHDTEEEKLMINNAALTAKSYTWENSAKKIATLLPAILALPEVKPTKLGVITTFNTICGIAEYSSFLYANMAYLLSDLKFIANKDATGRVHVDGENVVRLWEYGEADFSNVLNWLDGHKQSTGEYPFNMMHIQYSEGFYTLSALAALINGLTDRGMKTILTAHAFQVEGVDMTEITPALARLAQIHVLNTQDEDYLKSLGLKNTVHLPHGNITFALQSKLRLRKKLGISSEQTPVIGNHGFMSEGKGIMETIAAIAKLKEDYPRLLYLAINAVNPRNMTSQALSEQFHQFVKEHELENNVIHISDFLEKEDIILALAAADINIFAYPEAKQTASGAVRLAMAAGRPIIASESFQLSDLGDIAFMIANNKAETITTGLKKLLSNPDLYYQYLSKCLLGKDKNSWDVLTLRYLHLLADLLPKS